MKSISSCFSSAANGNITVITALASTVMAGIAGVTLMYVESNRQKVRLQASLDAGVLAGTALQYTAKDKDRIKSAEAAFLANALEGTSIEIGGGSKFIVEGMPKPVFTVKATGVSGVAYAKIENSLGAALGITEMDVHVGAKAVKRESDPLCLLTLGETAPKSLYVYGNAGFEADCPVQANSDDPEAISVSGAKSELSASMIGVTGGSTGSNITPTPVGGTEPVSDPYAFLPVPEPASCLMTSASIKTSQSLNPGTYCGGLSVKTGATVTLNPGIYIISEGQFRIDSGGRVEGEQVLIALVGKDSYIYMSSDSSAKLTSPTSGIYKNMQFMSDRDLSGSKFNEEWSTILSGATLEYDGAMYLPEQNFWASGTAHEAIIKAYSPAFAMVVDTAWIQGNAKIEIRQEDRRGIGEVSGMTGFEYSAKLVR